MRDKFERWVSCNGRYPKTIERRGGEYVLAQTQAHWYAWQACAAALSRPSLRDAVSVLQDHAHRPERWVDENGHDVRAPLYGLLEDKEDVLFSVAAEICKIQAAASVAYVAFETGQKLPQCAPYSGVEAGLANVLRLTLDLSAALGLAIGPALAAELENLP